MQRENTCTRETVREREQMLVLQRNIKLYVRPIPLERKEMEGKLVACVRGAVYLPWLAPALVRLPYIRQPASFGYGCAGPPRVSKKEKGGGGVPQPRPTGDSPK